VAIAGRNVRCGREEIDLVAVVAGIPVIVEVKTAHAAGGVDPADNLDRRKLEALIRAGAGLRPPIRRIDLVTVTVVADGVDVRWIPAVA
jgi:Holliday junction resolvase-like predicted endonuclease